MLENSVNGKPYLQSHSIKIDLYVDNYADAQILLDRLTGETETLGVANSLGPEGHRIFLLQSER